MQVVKFMVSLLPRKFLSKTCSLERSEQASMITSSQEVDLHCRFQGKRGFDAVTRKGSSPISTNGNEMKMSHGWILYYHGDLSPWICSRILCLVLVMANNATMMRAIISPWAASEDKYLAKNKKSDRPRCGRTTTDLGAVDAEIAQESLLRVHLRNTWLNRNTPITWIVWLKTKRFIFEKTTHSCVWNLLKNYDMNMKYGNYIN